jgi:hypothetical protein
MTQEPLWVDDIETALTAVVLALGGPKKVAGEMWTTEDPTLKSQYLKHCLTADRREKLSLREILWLFKAGREADCHTAMYFLTTECGYSEPMIVDPRDERQKLQREFIKSKEELARLLSKMDRLPKVVA